MVLTEAATATSGASNCAARRCDGLSGTPASRWCYPVALQASGQDECDNDNQQNAEDAYAPMSVSVTVSTKPAAKPAKQKNNQKNSKNGSQRHVTAST